MYLGGVKIKFFEFYLYRLIYFPYYEAEKNVRKSELSIIRGEGKSHHQHSLFGIIAR